MEKVVKFLTLYLVVGLFVSVLIVAAAHVLEVTALPSALKPVDAFIQTNTILRATAETLRDNLFWDYWSGEDASPPLFIDENTTTAVAPSRDPLDSEEQSPDSVRPPAISTAAPPEMPPEDPAREASPATDGPPGWGVVITSSAKAYTTSGKFLFRPAAGTLVKVSEVKRTKNHKLALSYPLTGQHANKQVLIPTEDLNLRPGSVSDVSSEVRELRVLEAQLLGEIESAGAEDRNRLRSDNPHAGEYGQAKAAYVDFWKNVKELQAQRDASKGSDHVRISDQLQLMKGDDIRLGQAYEAAKRNYEEWNRAHPGGAPDNARLTDLRRQLSEVRERLYEAEADQ